MPNPDLERLRGIKTFPSLVKYLRDDVDWPIESEHFDDLTFDFNPEELGIDPKISAKFSVNFHRKFLFFQKKSFAYQNLTFSNRSC